MRADLALPRRHMLGAGGCLLVALMAPRGGVRAQVAARVLETDQVDGFLGIGRDGGVTIYSGKVDLGTGGRPGGRLWRRSWSWTPHGSRWWKAIRR